jgi:hypothetical protein
MNIKKLLPVTVIIIVVFLFTSCAVNPYGSKLHGTWVALKGTPVGESAKNFNEFQRPQPPASLKDTTRKTDKNGRVQRTPEEIEYNKQMALHQAVYAETHSKLIILDDKKGKKIYPKKSFDFKYKVKKDGKLIVVKGKEGNRMTGTVEAFNDSTLTLIEHFDRGDLLIVYKKK